MMRKIAKKIAIALATMIGMGSTFGLSSCSFLFASTEDEMYTALAEAEKELFTERETLTCEISMVNNIMDRTTTIASTIKTESDITYSVQPRKNKMFITMHTSLTSGGQSVETEINVKLGKLDSGYYLYTKEPISQTVSEVNFYSISKDYAKSLMSFDSLLEFADLDIEELFKENGYSYTEMKNSYESVFAQQLAERKAVDENAQALSEMSIEKNSSEIALRQKMLIETADSSMKKRVCVQTEAEVAGKNDKIVKAHFKNDLLLKAINSEYISKYDKTELDINFSYDFDEEGYKAIDTGNTFTSSLDDTVGMASITLHVGELMSEQYVNASLLSNDLNFLNMTEGFRGEGYTVEWFADEKYQNAFNPNELSRNEFKGTENLYGKLTVEDGYVVCAIDYELNDTRDEAHKIVFGKKVAHYSGEEKLYSTRLVDNAIYTFLSCDEYIHEIYVDGNRQSDTAIVLENKKLYYIKYVEKIDNSTESIFDITDYFS